LDHWKASLQRRSDAVGMHVDAVVIGTAKVSRDAQNVLEVSRHRSVPAVGVVRGLKVCELVSTKDLDSLRSSAAGERADERTRQPYLQYESVSAHPILHLLPRADLRRHRRQSRII